MLFNKLCCAEVASHFGSEEHVRVADGQSQDDEMICKADAELISCFKVLAIYPFIKLCVMADPAEFYQHLIDLAQAERDLREV